MPIMDGITATKAIKTSDPNAKIVMCTAMGQKNILIEALQTGAKDYIVKPFQPERVLKSIKNSSAESTQPHKMEYIPPFVTASYSVLETVLGNAPVKGELAMQPAAFTCQQCSGVCGVTG